MATTKSTALAVKKAGGNVVSIQAELKALAAKTGERTEAATGSTIRVSQSKEFSLPDGNKTRDPIDVVIVDYTCKNVFYPGVFDAKNITPPVCFAIGDDPKSLAPSKNSPEPQAKACNVCSMNEFGSKGKGKACNNTRVLAVAQPHVKRDKAGIPLDEEVPLWLLNVSATAYKGFDAHVQEVARVFEVPPVGVVTTVGFNPGVDYPSLVFSNPVPSPDVDVHYPRMAAAKAMLAIEPDVSKYVADKKAPARGARR